VLAAVEATAGLEVVLQSPVVLVQTIDNRLRILTAFSMGKKSSISRRGKMAETSKDGFLLGAVIRHATATLQLTRRGKKFLLTYLILFKRVYTRLYISSAYAKEYVIAATYYCQVEIIFTL